MKQNMNVLLICFPKTYYIYKFCAKKVKTFSSRKEKFLSKVYKLTENT